MRDRYSILKDVLAFIESNLDQPMSVEDICQQAPMSKWEFQRLFRALIGDSVGGYLRTRRLTLAAEDLMNNPDKRILDIAIESGFNSQEAFARAFKLQFLVTPSEIRSLTGHYRKFKKPPMDPSDLDRLQTRIGKVPQIVSYDARFFVGETMDMKSHLDKDSDYITVAPELWEKFLSRRSELEHRMRGQCYGFALSSDGDVMEESIKYMAAFEVKDLSQIPPGMETLEVPAQTYALFEKKGNEEHSRTLIDYIYGIWLPNSSYERAEGHDYEIFGNQYKPGSHDSLSTYCLPVRPLRSL